MDAQFLVTFVGLVIAVIGYAHNLASSVKTDVAGIRKDMKDFEVTMAAQSAEFRGIMAKQDAEFKGRLDKTDAEFKMFLRCGRLPSRMPRFKGVSDEHA